MANNAQKNNNKQNNNMNKQKAKQKSSPLNKGTKREVTASAPFVKQVNVSPYFKIMPGRPKYEGSIRVQGLDFLQGIALPNSDQTGTNKITALMNPLASIFSNTRLQTYSRLYEKFVFRKLRFLYAPASATSTDGQYLMAFDKDVGDNTPPVSADGIRQYSAMQDFVAFQTWQPTALETKLTDPQDFYYTNWDNIGDLRLSHQGQFYLACVFPPQGPTSAAVYVEYDLELFDPQLETLNADTRISNAAVSPSATANAFWNVLNGGTITGNPIKFSTDTSGNQFIDFYGAGTVIIEQVLASVTNAAQILSPSFIAKVGGQVATFTLLDNMLAGAGGNAWRVDRVVIPPGGGRLYGSVSAAPGATTNMILRIISWLGSTYV